MTKPKTDPGLVAVMTPLDQLTPHPRNYRSHPDDQIEHLKASLTDYGWYRNVVVARGGVILAGHGIVSAAQALGLTDAPVVALDLDPDEPRALKLLTLDNTAQRLAVDDSVALAAMLREIEAGDDLLGTGFDLEGLEAFELALAPIDPPDGGNGSRSGSLAERFLIPPFSVLDARQGWWQDRKRAWIALGIQSEIGRGGLLAYGGQESLDDLQHRGALTLGPGERAPEELDDTSRRIRLMRPATPGGSGVSALAFSDRQWQPRKASPGGSHSAEASLTADGKTQRGDGRGATLGQGLQARRAEDGSLEYFPITDGSAGSGTSIFDPVLCELVYRWFVSPGGVVLDPFAGGSVRGIVAGRLGRSYFGVDLSADQIAANEAQAAIAGDVAPSWIVGDSRSALPDVEADLVFSCPPYADLEEYSDDPADLSTLDYLEFRAAHAEVIGQAVKRLRADRFAVWVIGEARGKDGNYYGLVPDTIRAFQEAGCALYNEAILVTAVGSLPIRAGKQFAASRKLGKTHQNVLVFVKATVGRRRTRAGSSM